MPDISHRIKELREIKKLSQVQFAKALGVTSASISFYENGKRKPELSFLNTVTHVFGVNGNWLITGEGEMFRSSEGVQASPGDILRLPVVAHIAAGPPMEVVDEEPLEWLHVPREVLNLPPPYYVFKVEGDSMEPLIVQDDYVILSRNWRGQKLHGKICGFRTWEGITLKRYMLQPKQKLAWLMPINHGKYEPVAYGKDTEDLVMFGVLVALIRKF